MTGKFAPYPTYRPSGVDLIRELPVHWEIKPLKALAHIRPSNVDKNIDHGEQTVRLCGYTDVYNNDRITAAIDFKIASASLDEIAKFRIRRGDVLLTKDSETADDIGVPALVEYEAPDLICEYHLSIVRARPEIATGPFLFWATKSRPLQVQFELGSQGVTRFGLSVGAMGGVAVPAPPLPEQLIIAAFLNSETAKIDALVEKQQRLLEFLKEKRQVFISRAVTKRLNSTVPMKNSGVEWLGDVPRHWAIVPMRSLFRFVKRQEEAVLEVLSVYRDYGVIEKSSRDDNINKTPEDLSKYQTVIPGDLVINKMKAWQGSLGISGLHGITSPDYAVFAPVHNANSAYLNFLLRCRLLPAVYLSISNGIRTDQWRLEPEKLRDLRVPLPPLPEQSTIAETIHKEERRLVDLISKTDAALALLRERRSALVTAAVTGKIDVRDASLSETLRQPLEAAE